MESFFSARMRTLRVSSSGIEVKSAEPALDQQIERWLDRRDGIQAVCVDQQTPSIPAAVSIFDKCFRAWNIRVLTVPSGTPTICATSLTSFPW